MEPPINILHLCSSWVITLTIIRCNTSDFVKALLKFVVPPEMMSLASVF